MNKDLVVLSLKNEDNSISRFLVYKFGNEEIKDYLVIGNVDKLYSQEKVEFLKRIIRELKEVFQITEQEKYLQELKKIQTLPGIDGILFTQEGFDLLNGKNVIFQNESFGRTINIECEFEEDIFFGNVYEVDETYKISTINSEFGIKKINYFDTWEVYELLYFFNSFDLNMIDAEGIRAYVEMNYKRMLRFLKLCFPDWNEKHWAKFSVEEQQTSLTQLADVVYSLSVEKGSKR